MASQYITFIIIFTLGLTLVLVTNVMFLNLSEQFQENIAEIELEKTLNFVERNILESLYFHTDSQQTIKQQIELPILLGQRFRYSIEITNSSTNNEITLTGFTQNFEIVQTRTFFPGGDYSVITNGKYQSTNPMMTLHIEKNENKLIIITIS